MKVAEDYDGGMDGGPARFDRVRKALRKLVLGRLVPEDELQIGPRTEGRLGCQEGARKRCGRIKVTGFDGLMVFRARCCNPIRGEKIIGYISRGKGVSVHSARCPNVINLHYDPERRIDVEWDTAVDVSRYTVRLTMQVEDRKGILADVSSKSPTSTPISPAWRPH